MSGERLERYSQRSNAVFEAALESRTAARDAAFFLPHLRSGMQLLDVGCGPGSITFGLAEAVAPGTVCAVDVQASQAIRAAELAAQRGVVTVRFQVGSVYDLPFADRSFDAAFAHAVLMFMREPVAALREIKRVLRPGGVVGLRDPDLGSGFLEPATPLLEQFWDLRIRVRQHDGGDPFRGRHYRRLLLEAGFDRTETTASVDNAGSAASVRRTADFQKAQLIGLGRTAVAEGWTDQATLDAITADLDEWADRPDASSAMIWCAALGWVSN